MARLQYGGFEAGHWHADGLGIFDTASGSAPVYDATVKRSGGYAAKWAPGIFNYFRADWTAVQGRTFYFRVWMRFDALPTAQGHWLQMVAGGSVMESLDLTTDGRISATWAGTPQSAPLATNTWHCVEMSAVGTASNYTIAFRVNGASIGSVTQAVVANPTTMRMGNISNLSAAQAPNVWFDDWALNDDTGTAQNSWPGTAEKTVLLLPVSDSAIGSDWRLDSFGDPVPAGTGYDRVNNVPPAGGTIGSAGDANQLRDGGTNTSTAPANLDVNVQSYSAAGIASTDTITAVQALAELGISSNVSSQSAAARLVSNPAEGSEVTTTIPAGAASSYPSSWTLTHGAILQNPSVTLGTSPVARAGKRTATGNLLACCLLGVYVGYEPSAAQTVSPSAISSAEAFGAPQINEGVGPSGIASAEAFGTQTVGRTVAPSGVESAEAFGAPRKVVVPRAHADLPHLPWPYRLGAVVEQDSAEELQGSAAVIACTPRGWRPDAPSFGVTTPLFEPRPVDTARLAAELARSDPRLSPTVAEAQALLDAARATVRIDVTGGRRHA